MKLRSTSLLILILAFAASCSQGNYAQVEPDDLYFTHKDRKEANANYMASASTNNSYDYNDRDVSNYTNQHSPTINSSTLASPTIQSTTETFYDANQNPDYVSVQANPTAETSSDYYVEDYGLPIIETETIVPQTVNNYNVYGADPYSNINPFSSWFNMSFSGSGYGSYYDPYYNQYNTSWGYYPYRRSNRDYNRYYNNFYYGGYNNNFYYGSGYPNYGSGSYCYNPIPISNSGYGNSNYGSSTSYNSDNGTYRDGTKIKTSPRRSRSTVSDYTNKQYTSRKRTSYNSDSGGRISKDTNSGRQVSKTVPGSREINPYKNNGTDAGRREKYGDMYSSSPTIQKTNTRRKINTTVQRQWSRGNSGVTTQTNRTNNGSTKGYSVPSRRGQSSGYSRPKSNSSSTPSRSKSSYTPSRSKSSGSSSYSSPSRSSSTQKSTPSRSSGTKSSSTTSRKRN